MRAELVGQHVSLATSCLAGSPALTEMRLRPGDRTSRPSCQIARRAPGRIAVTAATAPSSSLARSCCPTSSRAASSRSGRRRERDRLSEAPAATVERIAAALTGFVQTDTTETINGWNVRHVDYLDDDYFAFASSPAASDSWYVTLAHPHHERHGEPGVRTRRTPGRGFVRRSRRRGGATTLAVHSRAARSTTCDPAAVRAERRLPRRISGELVDLSDPALG